MKYRQITSNERYAIAALRRQGFSMRAIARDLERSPSTIAREVARNHCRTDGAYRPSKADSRTRTRRARSRRNRRFSEDDFALVERCIRLKWSPEQVAGRLRDDGILSISHQTIYLYVRGDRAAGGDLWRFMRQSRKKRRKAYRSRDSRGRLAGKRHISERPPEVETRKAFGHWEIDTVLGDSHSGHCILTIVERMTGYLLVGKLARHTAAETTERCIELIKRDRRRFTTITSDNGSEFHGYKDIEVATGVTFYFATPHHSWERGSNENTNGLIRQYLPKRTSMAKITQADCDAIARALNTRPRKRHDWKTPEECYANR
jgi:IS30 family transposase